MKVTSAPPPANIEQQIRDYQARQTEEQSHAHEQRGDQVNLSAESLRLADEATRDTAEKMRSQGDPSQMS